MNGGDGGDRAAAAPHHQAQAEPATATATRRTASNGTHNEEEEEGNHHGAGPAEGGVTEERSEAAVSHQIANGGTATSNGAHERGTRGARNRGRRERRNSNSGGGPAAATARPRSNSGKATNNGVGIGGGGRPATTTNSSDNSAATTATTTDRDGRRPRTLQKQQGKPEKPASKFQRQGQRGANGATAPATSHRRLPPPEVLAPAAATTPTVAAAAADVEDITHGVHAMGRTQQHSSSSSSKQQWIAKGPLPVKPVSTTSPVDADALPAAAAMPPPPPVVVQLPPRQKAPKVALEREKRAKIAKDMLLSFETLRPSDQEMQAKLDVIKRLQRIVGNLWPGYQAKLNLFGSSANGFCLKNSDLDICMTIDKRAGTKKKIVNRIARVLREHKMKDVTALSHASVPIVKFEDPLSKFSCDICINNILALHNTHMIAQYSRVDSRLLQLGYFVKHWAKCRKLDEPYTGTLSSYAWILLVINFLQQRSPPVLPCLQRVAPSGDLRGDVPVVMVKGHNCYYYSDDIRRLRFRSQNQETLAELLLEFFYLYAEEFDYEHMVVSVRRGTMLTKKEKRWDKLPKTVKENHWFSIEDPFDLTHDLGRVVDQDNLKAIQHEFRRAYTLLTTTSDLAEVCEQYISD